MGYRGIALTEALRVEELFTIHYFEYMSDFSFPGESHDFWEFVCVDKGEVEIIADSVSCLLKKGDIAFHQPNEFHAVRATGSIAPNLIVASFQCRSREMEFFAQKLLHIDERETSILAEIIKEAKEGFRGRFDDPYQTEMCPRSDAPLAYKQMIKLCLEQFLIHLLRRYTSRSVKPPKAPVKVMKARNDSDIFTNVRHYLSNRLSTHLTVEQICRDNFVSPSQLQKILRSKAGLSIIEYFLELKIEAAKTLIRSGNMNFTQISEQLGYTSIHYFSRQFKKIAGMTPSEYSSSIKAMADGSFEP